MADVAKVVTRIKMLAPQLGAVSADTLEVLAEDAITVATQDGFKDPKLEMAAGYLGAHYASVVNNQNSNVKKQTLSVMSIEYKDTGGMSDYLRQYQDLLDSLQGGANVAVFI